MKHDGKLNIAVGRFVNSRKWKNKKTLWSKLVDKLTKEHKTNETFKEYINSTKEEKLETKDVGGYVGGYLHGGTRKVANVLSRQLVTLDIDYAHGELWLDFTKQFKNAAVLHATHTHSEENPRYRLIMPLDREVSADEYCAISRQIAGRIGIELFDNTTFETHRLMFWPSSPIDVEYYCETQDGKWLDADKILDSYVDWKDSSAWPTAAKAVKSVERACKKQDDPLSKRGIIGAFCRTYTITEVIDKYLSDSYEEAEQGRYTYLQGSAAAGLVLYDDKFAFSHHGTDPISGKLCNAYDLVRLHLYGHLDNSKELQSTKRMEDLAREDQEVKKLIAKENIAEARYDFADDDEDEENAEPINVEWAKDLEVNGRGEYLSTSRNINIIIANDERLKSMFKFNRFDGKKYMFKSPPWRKLKTFPIEVEDVDFSGMRNYLETVYNISGRLKIDDALAIEFEKQSFHPVREYLSGLKWDGKKRVDNLLIEYFGAKDNAYTKEASRKFLCGAVARIFEPGVKFELMLILCGEQGIGKSTFYRTLAKNWFSDGQKDLKGKEAREQMQGRWIIEFPELAGLAKAEVETVKHFVSKQEDSDRGAYDRITKTHKRQCIFVGSTNPKNFLRDPSGNRRFMPVDVVREDIRKSVFRDLKSEVDQIWAEVMQLYKAGEKLYLNGGAETLAKKEQIKHAEIDGRTGLIEQFVDVDLPAKWDDYDIYKRIDYLNNGDDTDGFGKTYEREHVCVAEIWCECLGKDKADMNRWNTREINDILRSLEDWDQINSTRKFSLYGRQKYYRRKFEL